jgi:hypothetical protein
MYYLYFIFMKAGKASIIAELQPGKERQGSTLPSLQSLKTKNVFFVCGMDLPIEECGDQCNVVFAGLLLDLKL